MPSGVQDERVKSRAEKYAELRAKSEQAASAAGREAVAKQHERGKRSARERVEALVDEGSFVEFDRFVVHRTNAFGLDEKEFLGDGVITGRATHRRTADLPLLARLHGARRLARRGVRREDLQGDGSGAAHGIAADRHQRLGRRAHSGRRRLAGRLRRDLLAQRAGQRRHPANQPDRRSVRRRRRVLAGHHRLHPDDRKDLADVHHRPGDHQDGHRRGRILRRARRRDDARHAQRRRASGREPTKSISSS